MIEHFEHDLTPLPHVLGRHHHRPASLLRDTQLTTQQKREILAAWASDINAVENAPALRQLDNGAVVHIDDILDALKQLDGASQPASGQHMHGHSRPRPLKRIGIAAYRNLRRFDDDDDDDPPPLPSMAYPNRPMPLLDAGAVEMAPAA